ncbi:SMP-30/gluconolactonase/LRE family protein [Pararhizobium sp. PWRC1-1]|uniref:SMP-30/gluconolactonase/LRE family protein n=1 Tax=Pararhizobium sp. PWRC1-1 TaxID=2804566 RepID=UPI003CF1A0E9
MCIERVSTEWQFCKPLYERRRQAYRRYVDRRWEADSAGLEISEGRFWVGSISETTPRRPEGALYRIDHDGHCMRMLDGLFTSNGLAWSADGRRMFHSDSRGQIIRVFDYDPETGEISSGRVLARPSETEGRPDGGTVDSEGSYWTAGAWAGCLNRFSPEGQLLERQILPVAAPSMLCFGGPFLDQVFVTSLSRDTAKGSETGQLLSFSSKVVGLPGHRFRPLVQTGLEPLGGTTSELR